MRLSVIHTLANQVHYGEGPERLVLCLIAGHLEVSVPSSVSAKIAEHPETFFTHCPSWTPALDLARVLTNPSLSGNTA